MCAEAEGRGRLGARRGQWASWGTEGVERSPHVLGGGWRGDWLSTWSSVARPPFTCWNSWVTSGSRSPRSARPAWGSPCQRCWAGRPPAAAAAGTSHAPPRPSLAVHAIGTLGQAGKGSHGGMQALGGRPELTAALLGSGLCAPCTTTGRAPGWRLSPGLSELVRRCPRVSCHLGWGRTCDGGKGHFREGRRGERGVGWTGKSWTGRSPHCGPPRGLGQRELA